MPAIRPICVYTAIFAYPRKAVLGTRPHLSAYARAFPRCPVRPKGLDTRANPFHTAALSLKGKDKGHSHGIYRRDDAWLAAGGPLAASEERAKNLSSTVDLRYRSRIMQVIALFWPPVEPYVHAFVTISLDPR